MFDDFVSIPEPDERGFQFGQQNQIMSPRNFRYRLRQIRSGQFSNKLRENFRGGFSNRLLEFLKFLGPSEIKTPHIPDVLRRETRRAGKFLLQVFRQPFHHLLAIALGRLRLNSETSGMMPIFAVVDLEGVKAASLGGVS